MAKTTNGQERRPLSAHLDPAVDAVLRDGAEHGGIRRRLEAAVLVFLGAPEEVQDAVYRYVDVQRAKREPLQANNAYDTFLGGHERDDE